MAKLSNISRKTIAVIGFIIAAANAVPDKDGFRLVDLKFAILWFVGALFTWKDKIWAAILLALLTLYDLLRFIPDLTNLRSTAKDFSAEIDLAESTLLTVGIIVYSIAGVMYLCVLSYGIYAVLTKLNKQKPI